MTTYVYSFELGDGKNKMRLGGKGANLAEMTQIGLNVPPGFTITTEACLAYLEHDVLPDGVMDEVRTAMRELEQKTGKGFGSATNPLLVSVRSGSAMSMPVTRAPRAAARTATSPVPVARSRTRSSGPMRGNSAPGTGSLGDS